LPLFLIFLLVGAMLWVYYRQFPIAIPIPETRPGIQANDYIYPIFMLAAVPSVSSALTSLASVATMDFVRPLAAKPRTEEFYLRFSKVSTVGWAALLIVVAALTQHVESVLNAA